MSENVYIRLLHEARRRIVRGDKQFICFAIGESAITPEEEAAAEHLRSWINKIMDPDDFTDGYPTAEWWLVTKLGINGDLITHENMRAYRVSWIDHMIDVWKDAK